MKPIVWNYAPLVCRLVISLIFLEISITNLFPEIVGPGMLEQSKHFTEQVPIIAHSLLGLLLVTSVWTLSGMATRLVATYGLILVLGIHAYSISIDTVLVGIDWTILGILFLAWIPLIILGGGALCLRKFGWRDVHTIL